MKRLQSLIKLETSSLLWEINSATILSNPFTNLLIALLYFELSIGNISNFHLYSSLAFGNHVNVYIAYCLYCFPLNI